MSVSIQKTRSRRANGHTRKCCRNRPSYAPAVTREAEEDWVRRAHTIQAPHHMADPTAIVCAAGPQISERGLGRNARQVSKKAGRAADVDPVLTGRQIG